MRDDLLVGLRDATDALDAFFQYFSAAGIPPELRDRWQALCNSYDAAHAAIAKAEEGGTE